MSLLRKIPPKKAALGFLVFLVVFAITGFFIIPPILKSVLTSKLSEQLHRPVSIERVRFNPFMLSAEISGFTIREPQGGKTFVSFGTLYMNAQSISIFKGGPVLREVRLEKPYIHIVRNKDLSYNFSDLIKPEEKEKEPPSKPLVFSLSNIQLMNGSIDFEDTPKDTTHTVRDMHLSLPFVSNLPSYVDIFVQPGFAATVNGTPVDLKGKTKPFKDSLETSFQINVKDLDIPHYLAYLPVKTEARLKSCLFSMTGLATYTQYTDEKKSPTISVTGDMGIRTLELTDSRDLPVFTLPSLDIGIASSDLMTTKIHFSKIIFDSPAVNVTRDSAGRVNLLSLIPAPEDKTKEAKEEKKEGPPALIEADEIAIKTGKVTFSDTPGGHTLKKTIEPIDLKVAHFSTAKDAKSALSLSLLTELKESVTVEGDFTIEPQTSEGKVSIGGVQLKSYAPYYRDLVLFTVRDGALDFATRYSVTKGGNELGVILSSLEAAVRSLRLNRDGEKDDFLSIPVIGVKSTEIDLAKQEVTVGEFYTEKGVIAARRDAGGAVNLTQLVPPASPPKQVSASPPAQKTPQKSGKPWIVTVKDLRLDRYTVKGEDLIPAEPVKMTLERINLRASNLSTGKKRTGRVALSLATGGGTVSVNGQAGINPLSANLKVRCTDLSITPFQPYFTDKVKIIVADGLASTSGDLALSEEKEGLKISYTGDANLTRFASLDKASSENFLKWNSLHAGGINAVTNPFSLKIGEVALTDFYSRLIINADGTLNVQHVMEKDKVEEKVESAAAESAPTEDAANKITGEKDEKKLITVDKVTLQGGTINFTDNYIKPNYSANLVEVGGKISGLSSMEDTFADVDLKGRLDNYAPLEITGKINPLREDLFVDLKVDFKDIDLSSMTPYSGKYVGYTIQKGKLTLGLRYLIVKGKLEAQNSVFLDQFTLGDQVESPDATRLPVSLAIALLKNSRGEIKLDLPVSGSLDDPQFRIGGVIVQILVNLLVKAATSPFALLGSIFGGGEELSYLDFNYGLATIDDVGGKKIDTLVKALADRPGLKLEITGHADMENDREGLRQHLFQRKVKAQKLKELLKKGQAAIPVEEVVVAPEEYARYLKSAYGEEKFPKPRNVLGFAKDLPPAEMEKLMLTHTQVTDDDLRQLASRRAQQVKDRILKSGQVAAERLFLVEPKTLQPEKKEKMRDSRVDFSLR